MRRRWTLACWLPGLAAMLAMMLAGCGAPPPPPAVLTLKLEAGRDQNPNAAGQPAPVAVRVLQLGSTARFDRADVFALLEREAATLGDELAAAETVVVAPGEAQTLTRTLKPGVQAIGVVAAFRDIDRARWRASAPVAASGPVALTLRTAGTDATLTPAKP